jgi:hypothetical protein
MPIPTSFGDFARATWERFDRIELQNKQILDNQSKIQESVSALADNQREIKTTLDQVRRNYYEVNVGVKEVNERSKQIYADAHSVAVGWVDMYGGATQGGGPSRARESHPTDMELDPTE